MRRHACRSSVRLDRCASLTNRACAVGAIAAASVTAIACEPDSLPTRSASSTNGNDGNLLDAHNMSLAAATLEPACAAR